MLDVMYELPDRKGSGEYVMDEEIVDGNKSLFDTHRKSA